MLQGLQQRFAVFGLDGQLHTGNGAEQRAQAGADQGLIVGGRRSGTSTNLAVSARRRYDKANGIKRQAGFARGTAA